MTVRSRLLAALGLFLLMLVIGAVSGMVALTRANQSTALVHMVSVRVIGINDAYKDTTPARAALVRAHAALLMSWASCSRKSARCAGEVLR
jgi:methyl-accepting chemotaxis protein